MPDTPHGSAHDGSSTSPRAPSSVAPADESPNATTRSTTSKYLDGLDISRLSPKSRATLIRINDPVQDGWKETELASKLGRTPSWVSERLSELRTEILLQNGLFPPLTDAEEAALRDSIRRYGVIAPVMVDEDVELIDGRNRLLITSELALPCPFFILADLTAEEKREIGIAINAARRQLNRQQRRKLIEHELMHDSARSDRRIAAICGVSHPTVAAVRAEITQQVGRWRELELPLGDAPPAPAVAPDYDAEELSTPVWQRGPRITHAVIDEAAHIPDETFAAVDAILERRTDALGRSNPVRTRSTPPPKTIATAPCPCCGQPLDIVRTAGAYTLAAHD